MQKSLTKLRNLLHKDKKPASKAGYWFLPIGVVAIAAVGYLLADSPLFTADAADILPARNLGLYAEIGSPQCDPRLADRLPALCEERDLLLTALIGEYPQRIDLFADEIVMVSYAAMSESESVFAPTFLLRVTNAKEAEDFVRNLDGNESAVEEIWENIRVLRFSEPRSREVFFWQGWLVISSIPEFYKLVAEVDSGITAAIAEEGFWQGLDAKLADSSNRVMLRSSLLKPYVAVGLQPLIDFVPEIGIALTHERNRISLSVATNTSNTFFDQNKPLANDFQSSLLRYFPNDDEVLMSRVLHPQAEIEWVLDYLDTTDPAFAFFVRGQTRRFLEGLFGDGISLENDILPLVDNEVAFALYQNEGSKPDFLITLDTDDAIFAAAKKEKLLTALQTAAANFVPRVLEHVLEDGSVIREVAACDDCISTETETVGNAEITTFVTENGNGTKQSLTLGLREDIFVVTSEAAFARAFLTDLQAGQTDIAKTDADDYDEFVVVKPELLQTFFPDQTNWFEGFAEITIARETDLDYLNLFVEAGFEADENK